MLTRFFAGLLLTVSQWSEAEAPNSNHRYIMGKIVEYTQAFDRCNQIVEGRAQPDNRTIEKLNDFSQRDIERLMMSKAELLRHECEKPALTELAYAIVITESEELQQHTRGAISAIKALAFSGDIRKFTEIYQSVPTEMRQALEGIDYFDRPFDERLILEAIRKEP